MIKKFNEFINEGIFFKNRLDFKVLEEKLENCYLKFDKFEVEKDGWVFKRFTKSFSSIVYYIYNRIELINKDNVEELVEFKEKLKWSFWEPYNRNYASGNGISFQFTFKEGQQIINDAIKKLILVMKKVGRVFSSYEYQKELLTNHPERIDELKEYGLHNKIKQEFPSLARGVEWGFFDLNNEK